MRWIIQQNVGPEEDIQAYSQACKTLGLRQQKVTVSPFATKLPDFIDRSVPSIFLGGVSFIRAAFEDESWAPYVWADLVSFNYATYLLNYGSRMLNSDAIITTFDDFLSLPGSPEELVFVRPVLDNKAFPGVLIERINFQKWAKKISGKFDLSKEEILVARPVGVTKEWRTFIVDGKVITASEYSNTTNTPGSRNPFRKFNDPVPSEVIAYAEDCARLWSPAPVFCLDVALSKELYVMECGTLHSCGLYESSALAIVRAIEEYCGKGKS